MPPDDPQPGGVLLLGMGWFPDEPGGLNRYFRDLGEALYLAGTGVRGVAVGPTADPPAWLRTAGSARDPLVQRLIEVLHTAEDASSHVSVVDAHFVLYAFLPLLGPLRHLPLVVHFHGPWAAESASVGQGGVVLRVKRLIETTVYRRADRLIVLSPAFRRILVEDYGVSPWRIRVIPPGVDLARFTPGDRQAARKRMGAPVDGWVASTVRRLVPRMGLDVLLEAWAQVDDGFLLIGGEGPERARLEDRARELKLEGRVRFLGRVPEPQLADLYRASDVTIVPSVALEGFGLVTLEALASGTPVIGSDLGGIPETLRSLDPSLLVPPGKPQALAQRLREARAGTRPLPDQAACRGLAESFSWGVAASATRAVYAEASEHKPRRRIRVVYLDHTARMSGGEIALLNLLPALRDVDAHVILAEDGPLVSRLQARGISVEVLPLAEEARGLGRQMIGFGKTRPGTLVATAIYTLRLARRLRGIRPDIVHTNSLKAALYGGVSGRVAGVPVVWHVRDRIARDYMPSEAVRLVRAVARRLPMAIIVNSLATQATLPNLTRHMVVDPIPFPVPGEPSSNPEPRDGSAQPLRVGMLGRLAPWKGQDVFLRAFAQAFPTGQERAVLVGSALFGEDAYAARLHQLTESLGLVGRVHFRGFREDVWAELAEVDILVHASIIPEPFGQVVVEGMAAGLPVIAAHAGGPTEIITDGLDGLLVPPGDAAALAAALRRLADNPDLRVRLGAAGRRRARDFDPDRVALRVLAVYRSVLGR